MIARAIILLFKQLLPNTLVARDMEKINILVSGVTCIEITISHVMTEAAV